MTRRCIALLGGSFDPVHKGHVALADYFVNLLAPDELRILPAGNPWQKQHLQASAADRVEMLRRAFDRQKIPVIIDQREIQRHTATYSIDTLRALRTELGSATSIAFLIGADQLQQLHTWREWRQLFNHAHICAASRPGFAIDAAHMPQEIADEFEQCTGTPQQIRTTPYGLTYLATELSVDISATQIRAALQHGAQLGQWVPSGVLDYIQQHHLYRN